MIKVVAKSEVKKGEKDKVLGMLDEMIEKTRAEEGCISYELYEDVNNPNIITFIEEWENEESLNNHIKSEHFQRIIPVVNELKVNPGPADVYKKIK